MITRINMLVLFVIFVFCSINPSSIHAAWDSSLNNPISVAVGNQWIHSSISDGNGGAIIAWLDNRNGNWDIYAQRINASGVNQWTVDGVAIRTVHVNHQYYVKPGIVSDGSGGAIITWSDDRKGYNKDDIYAQRINTNGEVLWAKDGVEICTEPSIKWNPSILSDGSGGAIIAWHDSRIVGNIYAQRIDTNGEVQWAVDGIEICTRALSWSILDPLGLTSDGNGGAIITWRDGASVYDTDIYAQRFDMNGVMKWPAGGVAICSAIFNQDNPTIISDGSGGAIITWRDGRNGYQTTDIYAQRINTSGEVLWPVGGVAISTSQNVNNNPGIISDGSGGAIITWFDNSGYGIHTQRINSKGEILWTIGGVAICLESSNSQAFPSIISDGDGGAIIAWGGRSAAYNASAQRIDPDGVLKWAANGVAISPVQSWKERFSIVSDDSGGAIITWDDHREDIGYHNSLDIYAQRIYAGGTIPDFSALQVSLLPQDAINAGAQWRVDSGDWQDSGALVTGLSVGDHTIAFKSVPYWSSPTNQNVTIVKYQIATAAGNYTQLVKGDVNGDDQVNLTDAILCLQILSGLTPDNINPAADVGGGGKIGMPNAIYATQRAAGL